MQDYKIYATVTVNAKGQIVIPVDARKKLGISSGDQLLVISKGDFVLGLIKANSVNDFLFKIEQDSPGFFDNCKQNIDILKNYIS